ncbi:hypothetical protein BGX20_002999 [Mortierella sp. AD010]|nr:hypothetical protein BGX20_002999 [Mortierella sp. AD010]
MNNKNTISAPGHDLGSPAAKSIARLRARPMDALEESLYLWYLHRVKYGHPVTDLRMQGTVNVIVARLKTFMLNQGTSKSTKIFQRLAPKTSRDVKDYGNIQDMERVAWWIRLNTRGELRK